MKLLAAFFKKAPSSVVVELDEDVAPVQELEATMKAYGFSIEDLETSFVIDSPTRIPEIYLKCFHLHKGELIFDQSTIVEQNFLFWIPERTELFKRLDIEFMRAAETEDKKLLQEVKIQKAFLRDLPTWTIIKIGEIVSKKDLDAQYMEYLHKFSGDGGGSLFRNLGVVDSFDSLTVSKQVYYRQLFNSQITKAQALLFTPYYNILKIEIEEEGGGYQSPPELKFDCDYGMACPPQYNCILEDGKLVDVELVTVGCGYVTPLTITVSEPEEGEKRAIVSAKIFNKVEITYPTFG